MSEKSFAYASMSLAIVTGVFFYPPSPVPHPPRSNAVSATRTVGALQQAHTDAGEARGARGEIGVD
ncbi:MAG: hypothetical protein ACJ8GW_02460 [Massilia sp.]